MEINSLIKFKKKTIIKIDSKNLKNTFDTDKTLKWEYQNYNSCTKRLA